MDHQEPQLPGPPRARQALGAVVMLMGALLLLGWLPFSLTTFAVALVLVGAGLVV